jgi:hypothetical protein
MFHRLLPEIENIMCVLCQTNRFPQSYNSYVYVHFHITTSFLYVTFMYSHRNIKFFTDEFSVEL